MYLKLPRCHTEVDSGHQTSRWQCVKRADGLQHTAKRSKQNIHAYTVQYSIYTQYMQYVYTQPQCQQNMNICRNGFVKWQTKKHTHMTSPTSKPNLTPNTHTHTSMIVINFKTRHLKPQVTNDFTPPASAHIHACTHACAHTHTYTFNVNSLPQGLTWTKKLGRWSVLCMWTHHNHCVPRVAKHLVVRERERERERDREMYQK